MNSDAAWLCALLGVDLLADRGVLRGENSKLVAAPETLFLPVVLAGCLRPELGAVRGLNIPARIPRSA